MKYIIFKPLLSKKQPPHPTFIYVLLTIFTIAPMQLFSLQLPRDSYGVVKDPVIEMHNSVHVLSHQPASPDTAKCMRAHQALYNEIAKRISQFNGTLKISLPKVFYGIDEETKQPRDTFFTSAHHVIPLEELPAEIVDTIPNPNYAQEPTIVLRYPWNNFSVGTRFKHTPAADTNESYGIVRADFQKNKILVEHIPHKYALEETQQDPHLQRRLFVKVVNDFINDVQANNPDGVIPLIWGGSSFIKAYKQSAFYLQDGAWHRIGKTNPYTGYDASEFVMRMAKIAGIDFPWKTTTIMKESLQELTENDLLEEGDLIWVPGGIAIISNLEKNEVIGVRSYSSGYGCVARLTLSECFENIATYDDLRALYNANIPLRFKDKEGNVLEKSYSFKLLKLMKQDLNR